jgi:hypothetical protein
VSPATTTPTAAAIAARDRIGCTPARYRFVINQAIQS